MIQPQSGRRYLISVIGFSSTARTITSGLTLVSFPVALRAVGAEGFGLFAYATAILNVIICVADFGIAAATGKAIAEARAQPHRSMRDELLRGARLQLLIAVLALAPVVLIAFFSMLLARNMHADPLFLVLMVLGSWVGVGTNFIRSGLRSYLAFGKLAALDATESVARTASWLGAAWLMPSATGLALAGVVTAVIACLAGAVVLAWAVSRARQETSAIRAAPPPRPYRRLLRESVSFLGMGISTRIFQSVPMMVFGALLDQEMVGLIGAFARLLEIVSFPFLTIGNALAVRAHEVKSRGIEASTALWDACWRFVVLAAIAAGAFFLAADAIARVLVPRSGSGPWVFAALSFAILTYCICCFIPTMSDFVGGLQSRIVFLATLALVEAPALALAVKLFGEVGAVLGYLLVQIVMVAGYVAIAKRVFFGSARYQLPRYILESCGIVLLALGLAVELRRLVSADPTFGLIGNALLAVAAYLGIILCAFAAVGGLRRRFLSPSVFEFTVAESGVRR